MNARTRQRLRFQSLLVCWVVSCLGAAMGRAAETDELPLIQIEARFFHATEAQVRMAFQSRNALQTLARLRADLFSNSSFVATSGERAKVEAVREMRYPTQFDPAKDKSDRLVPTAFETRNVGVILEIEAAAEADNNINLSVTSKVVRFMGFIDYGRRHAGKAVKESHDPAQDGKKGMKDWGVYQPVFNTQQVTTSVTMNSSDTILACELPPGAVSREIAPDGLRTLVFITARILPPKSAANPQPIPP